MKRNESEIRVPERALGKLRELVKAEQEARARTVAFVSGLLAGMGIDETSVAGIDADSGVVRLKNKEDGDANDEKSPWPPERVADR